MTTIAVAHSSGQSASGVVQPAPDTCIGGSLARLMELMVPDEVESMDLLAERFGTSWTRIPVLIKVAEDSLIWRLYGEAVSRGGHDAVHRAALRRVANLLGASQTTVRYRVEAIQVVLGQRSYAAGVRPRALPACGAEQKQVDID